MNSIYCNNCKQEVNENDKFCPHCGAPVVANSSREKATIHCPKCNHENEKGAAFCEKCGASLSTTEAAQNQNSGPQTFTSTGNYSGKMIKGKTSRGWKIFRNILLTIVLLAIISLVIWFQVDPDAGKKLTDALMGIAFMAVFFLVGWLFMRGKKGKGKRSNDDYDWDHNDDNDFNDDDDD